jgi:arylsulfatase A
VFTDFLIEFIERNRDRPFLAYYPMVLTHFPKNNEPKGPNGRWETFGEMVSNMDQQVGRIVKAVENAGLRDNTLILFTADNGTPTNVRSMLGDKQIRGGKAKLTDAGTRVPLIARQVGSVPVGVNDDLIDFTDFLPTLAELGHTQSPNDVTIDGRSFAAQLRGERGQPRQWVFTQWSGKSWIRNKQWKLYDDGRLLRVPRFSDEEQPVAEGQAMEIRQQLKQSLNDLLSSARPQSNQ